VKKFSSFLLLVFAFKIQAVTINADRTAAVKLMILGVGDHTNNLKKICENVKKNLEFTGQFEVTIDYINQLTEKKQVLGYQSRATLSLAINYDAHDHYIEWGVFNTKTGQRLESKRVMQKELSIQELSNFLADGALHVLTGQKGPFCAKLVYCKEDAQQKKSKTHLCIADYHGAHEQIIQTSELFLIAPRWSGHDKILYSEYTPVNMRLMVTDCKGNKQIATDFNGLNMLPSFSHETDDVVVCLSAEGSSQIYRYRYNSKRNRPEYIRLTFNEGNNLSPCIIKGGDIVFCSDFETGRPQIYKMDKQGKNIICLSQGGSCTCPAYSYAKHAIAYAKIINGVSQIMIHDLNSGVIKQVTHDQTHKEEASWSTCGNYLVFSVSDKKTKRLAIQSLLTNQRKFITGTDYRYSYPCWS
jgi:tol-pal system beta propeller repeat protein TolB